MPHVEDKNNVNISEKNASEYFIHTVDIVDDDTEGGKEVEEINEHLSDGIVGGIKEVQEIDHGEAEAGGEEPHQSAPRDTVG